MWKQKRIIFFWSEILDCSAGELHVKVYTCIHYYTTSVVGRTRMLKSVWFTAKSEYASYQ